MVIYHIYADSVEFYNSAAADDPSFQLISPVLTMELNKAGSLKFTLPPGNIAYNSLQKLKTLINVFKDDALIWRGRVVDETKDFYNRKQIYCEGQLSFMNDALIAPYNYSGTVWDYMNLLVDTYNDCVIGSHDYANVVHPTPYGLMRGTTTVTDANNYIVRSSDVYANVGNELINKCLNIFGCYLVLNYDHYGEFDQEHHYEWSPHLHYLTTPGGISDQVIRFGENLLDLEEYIDASDVFTVLVPLGGKVNDSAEGDAARLNISSVNDGEIYIENQTAVNLFGKIWRTLRWDDVTVASNLLSKGQEALDQSIAMSVTLSINAVDLHLIDVDTESFNVGESVRVVSDPHGLDAYFLLSKMEIPFDNPAGQKFTFGAGFSAMTDQQVAAAKKSASAVSLAETAAASISQVTVDIQGNYVTKSEFTSYQSQVNNNFTSVNNKLVSALHYKGNVASESALPASGDTGDVYNVTDTGANYAWNGSSWDKLSETVDLSGYTDSATFAALEARVAALEGSE